ncbi:hypothetical protein V6N12_044281 [Hibiscus sabdariffa]|uniref:Uncharacterized protein n=1 Tax=Hibiscus sabdariffa TaxID=183260 RepID=A0ABR2DGU0_9ROSI
MSLVLEHKLLFALCFGDDGGGSLVSLLRKLPPRSLQVISMAEQLRRSPGVVCCHLPSLRAGSMPKATSPIRYAKKSNAMAEIDATLLKKAEIQRELKKKHAKSARMDSCHARGREG